MRLHKIEKGRYALYLGKTYGDPQIRFEFSRSYSFGLGWRVEREEQDLQFSLYCFKLFNVWLTFSTRHLAYKNDPVQTGIVWDPKQHIIHTQILDESSMDSSKPALFRKYWNYADWLFGRSIYSESRHGRKWDMKYVEMWMPERVYRLELDFYTSYWHRPRSPFVRAIERVDVKPDIPVGVPGKGENSYDQDEDATFSSTQPRNRRTEEKIAEDFQQDILATREKRASRDWKPTHKWKQPEGEGHLS